MGVSVTARIHGEYLIDLGGLEFLQAQVEIRAIRVYFLMVKRVYLWSAERDFWLYVSQVKQLQSMCARVLSLLDVGAAES